MSVSPCDFLAEGFGARGDRAVYGVKTVNPSLKIGSSRFASNDSVNRAILTSCLFQPEGITKPPVGLTEEG